MSFQMQASFTGDRELAAKLQAKVAECRKEFRRALVVLGEEKLAITQERVPVKKGDLKATGRISVRAGEKQVSLGIFYGSADVRYAARVHEDLEAKHPNGGQAKFVESVINETNLGEELAGRVNLR